MQVAFSFPGTGNQPSLSSQITVNSNPPVISLPVKPHLSELTHVLFDQRMTSSGLPSVENDYPFDLVYAQLVGEYVSSVSEFSPKGELQSESTTHSSIAY